MLDYFMMLYTRVYIAVQGRYTCAVVLWIRCRLFDRNDIVVIQSFNAIVGVVMTCYNL